MFSLCLAFCAVKAEKKWAMSKDSSTPDYDAGQMENVLGGIALLPD